MKSLPIAIGLTLFTQGLALAAPIDGCDGQPVIMVVSGHTLDRSRMQAYNAALQASGLYAYYGGYYINVPRPVIVLEGEPEPEAVSLMVRFPCLANVQAFWNSDIYQTKVRPLRVNPEAGSFRVAVYREVDIPEYMLGKVTSSVYLTPQVDPNLTAHSRVSSSSPSPFLRRSTILISDLSRAMTLYRDTLGFTPGTTTSLDAQANADSVFGLTASTALNFTSLSAGKAQPDVLGLITVARLPRRPAPPNATIVRTFGKATTLPAALERLGLNVHATSALNSPIFGIGSQIAFYDWDNNLIVVTDF
jgi:uncharacterized protein (DUF1330 family)